MAIPVATALGRRDRIWPTVIVSVIAHALVVAWALARRPPPPIDLQQKPIIAKLVRLGEKRPEEWLPRKDAAPPPPVPPAAAPAPVAAPSAPKPSAPAPKAPPPRPAPASAAGKPAGSSLASILTKVQRQVEEARYGAPDGDPAGDSDSGSEGDRYLAMVRNALASAYVVPATISDRERLFLKATVVLFIEPNGRVVDFRFEARSGNPSYDAALERAIRVARLPPPPPEMREQFRRNGFGVKFHL
ncbi:MAG TPA: energy transducer TonB [Anaeromyxobacter sp.]